MPETLALGELHRARILCLHGGGMNAPAFRLQCRALARDLQSCFRLVFVNGPYESPPDPKVLAAYAHLAPFRRWLRWKHEHPDPGPTTICHAIHAAVITAIDTDNAAGADGEFVGLMGFSQGAKVAASILLEVQSRLAASQSLGALPQFRFGILLAGRAPLVCLSPDVTDSLALADANEITTGSFTSVTGYHLQGNDHVLRIPTLHVHGLLDPGIAEHRELLHNYCDPDTASVVEWGGDHRVLSKSVDVAKVVQKVLEMSRKTGVISEKAEKDQSMLD